MATMVTLGSPARAPKMQKAASRDSLTSMAPSVLLREQGTWAGEERQPGGLWRLAEGSEAGPRGLFVLAQ